MALQAAPHLGGTCRADPQVLWQCVGKGARRLPKPAALGEAYPSVLIEWAVGRAVTSLLKLLALSHSFGIAVKYFVQNPGEKGIETTLKKHPFNYLFSMLLGGELYNASQTPPWHSSWMTSSVF